MTGTSLPSGAQHVLTAGDARAVVVAVGGGLRSHAVAGRELLDGYAETEMATSARGQLLVPWPNRLGDGRYTWDGTEHQLPLTEPAKGNAIHGLARWVTWTAGELTTASAELTARIPPQPGYPFSLEVTVRYALTAGGLTVSTTGRNTGSTALPYALGQHPYLSARGRVDACSLALDAATYLPTDDRGLPTGAEPVEGTSRDFRARRPIGDVQLDVAFTDLARDSDGKAWVTLGHPDGGEVRLWVDESFPYIELFTGDTLPDRSRRRQGLGVEPMTAPPNAFATGTDVVRLEPGESVSSSWGLASAQ